MMWIVYDWNNRAIEFYKGIGATIVREWLTVKMEKTAMTKIATDTSTTPQ